VRYFAFLFVAAGGLALPGAPAAPAGAAAVPGDWPVFRGDALMSGVGQAKLPDQLAEKWVYKCGDGVECAPAVVGGVVYVASLDKHLHAVDLATGKMKWKTKLSHMKASPAVKGGRVYVGDLDGKFHCLDAATGAKVWDFDTEGEVTAGANFHADQILIGSYGGATLYCLTADGKKKWDFKIDGGMNGAAAVVGDNTFAAGCDRTLHVIDVPTGKEVGSVELGGEAGATAAVAGESVYVGTMANQVVAVNWKKQAKEWAFEPAKRAQAFYASAAVTDDVVVSASRDKKVYALDRKTGRELWNFATAGQVDASPVVVGGRVYVGCLSGLGEFYVLDLTTGRKVQEVGLDGAVGGSVAVGPDCILVGTDKGSVYCLGAK
jgi:outer membrane protein assembly factor BamB